MSDRKKVIRAVETCFDSWIDKHRNMGLDLHEVERLKREALEMLKEQEPIQMQVLEDYGSIKFGYCPKCKSLINNRSYPKSCGCGQAVKWDE